VRRVLTIAGTRPEAVKLGPVIRGVAEDPRFAATVVVTAQHRGLLDPVLGTFDVKPDYDLNIFRPGQTLDSILARCVEGLGAVFAETNPDIVLVQGDTTTVLAGALAALHAKVPVGHVEAGLRTKHLLTPWPEEGNRRAVTHLSTLHFAPTADAAQNLAREGVDESRVFVTGNTVVDALLWCRAEVPASTEEVLALRDDERRLVLVTLHRRESWGGAMTAVAEAIAELARADPGLVVLFPVHRNPVVRQSVEPPLRGIENVRVVEPLEYPDFVEAMARSSLIITDSGGVQEEAPTFGVPVLIVREETERPDALRAGARLVGTDGPTVLREATEVLLRPPELDGTNPFGDGRATERILSALGDYLG
jgi:UDP-N-acetylglucosamine 2-epimerase (non-hydrolysing)